MVVQETFQARQVGEEPVYLRRPCLSTPIRIGVSMQPSGCMLLWQEVVASLALAAELLHCSSAVTQQTNHASRSWRKVDTLSFEVGDLRNVILAWNSRGLGAATEMPISSQLGSFQQAPEIRTRLGAASPFRSNPSAFPRPFGSRLPHFPGSLCGIRNKDTSLDGMVSGYHSGGDLAYHFRL